ncbi:MAG: hypothetical protein WC756_03710 [Taibaiella sp.]|jgi:phage tail sheath gpL-like
MNTPAVGSERTSKIVGYKITKGNFQNTTSNLPQRIAILAEANTAQQAGLSTDPYQILSASEAGTKYGFGSPIYNIARILLPVFGDGVGGIPVFVYPQAAAGGSAARVQTITVTGTATATGVHTLVVNGRSNLDGSSYDFSVVSGDTPTVIAGKIADALNNVLGAPATASPAVGVVTATTKWTGLTSQDVNFTVSNNGASLGVTYAVAQTVAGSGTPSVSAALTSFGAVWNTIVINSYGTVTSVMDALEQYNGIPDPNNPTGRYAGIIMKPFIAITGSLLDNPTTVTDTRKLNVTLAIAPAPLSAGLPMEAAANMALLFATVSQNTPHLDVSGRNYPDMPTPVSIGLMADYNNRDAFVKKGSSTVNLVAGVYQVCDFVTTYHPDGENPPQFRYCRNLNIDWNVRFSYYVLEQIHVVDHVIAADNDIVTVDGVVKPKTWKQVLTSSLFADLTKRALTTDAGFSSGGLLVNLDTQNPDRLNTFFPYKRTGYLRIASTEAQAGFNFGAI